MCGIVGFVNTTYSKDEKADQLEQMMARIVHRGPDNTGQFIDEGVGLGFRRLSIIDLKCGNQPIFNENDTKAIIFNGEIYNYQELQQDLQDKGHVFKTSADTEVILHGYEEYGTEIVQKLRGMFTFAIWDREKQELFGARDHFGIKPLYYYHKNNTFMFGSEIKSFLDHPAFEKQVNPGALKPYMTFQYPATDETFFKDVYRVPEGHYFFVKNGEVTFTQYWDMEYTEENMTEKEAVDLIDQAVQETTNAHLISDVEVGTFLSSGVDSSLVTTLAKPQYTFSIGFGEHTYNESSEAKKLTDILNLRNYSRVIESEEAFNAFPEIQYHLDEPSSNASCVPLYFLAKLAREHVKVVLSGEGADELFAGYTEYGFSSNSKMVRVFAQGLKKLPKKSRYRLASRLKNAHNFHGRLHLYQSIAPAEDFFIGQAFVFDEDEAADYLQPTYQQSESVHDIVHKQYQKVPDLPDLKKMQYLDMHQWMPKDILLKADKMTMAHSLEARTPLLDTRLMEVAEKIPSKYLLNSKETKYAFRKAAHRHLPEEWANRKKLGFPVPIKDWLHEEQFYHQVRDVFSSDFAADFFDQGKILDLLDRNYQQEIDARRKIWTIYSFLTWYKVYFVEESQPKS
ncbi:asparagine synthase (glutamine-hydrolyzing) [Tetragenococcus halophilus]|uniref:asparagine synthase (glutamine-hydrolyzing) n=1 Tax=Tetragenococcus halophilus (strain DSM 20338 / JCM 20259 / NCIMB 9735 / NBRC 12172) TaxID=945021 RepID=A0AAN1SGD8_TETHN|nr:asparagine synthase (glutamine-hydrolyzing) [Tetragenococcus halophilus]AOF48557.1 asparagine synthase [Tetragenococcus halophilus]NWO01261.1 asparagine synthase (glutamine-hydrolyzing) [Tetragenococcus halophilus]QXN86120.1 asparagine synthase (glutamine-hydrolyzing) [Tetragenococcus halophilus]RQD32487.1 asparagine synthase (glutamine-hydrolyzing) [Tetragenococcus halophilus subsp. halophilus DSM 20339]WJS81203.1 asparagine synthase (glutamine-hydrolyzing) [Tetragenococcus halophilus]